MKWQSYKLADDDDKVKRHVLENLLMGVRQGNALSARLTAEYSGAAGPAVAIAFESLDLEKVGDFRRAGSYANGKFLNDALAPHSVPLTQFPIAGMVQFLEEYLQRSEHSVVVFENLTGRRKDMAKWPYAFQSRRIYLGEQVYHILTHRDVDTDVIDCTIRESKARWGVGVCSACREIPQTEVQSEAFFDEIAARTAHIFVPAFDGEGFLIWSPTATTTPGELPD